MGTAIEAEIAAYEPSAISWPAEDGKLYTLVSLAMGQFAMSYCLGGIWRLRAVQAAVLVVWSDSS